MENTSRNEQLLHIRKHTGACADPTGLVDNLSDVLKRKWEKNKTGQICTSFIENGKRMLMSYDGRRMINFDISNVEESDLVNAASQEETFDRVQAKMSIHRNKFLQGQCNGLTFSAFDPDLYRLNFVRQGEQVVVPAEPDTVVSCILAAMHPTYYDFNVYDDKYEDCVNYSNKKSKNIFEHSGDIVEQNTLLHFAKLKNNKNMNHKMSLFITGYMNTPLQKFDSQSPANLLFDHQKKIIHIIEFPLDAASVGDATLGIPGVGQIKNGYLYFDVFTKPETGNGSAPSYNQETWPLLKSAVFRFSSCNEEVFVSSGVASPHEASLQETKRQELKKEEGDAPHILEVHVGKVKGSTIQASHLIKIIGGVSCHKDGKLDERVHSSPPGDLGNVVLPGLLGPIEGPFICLAGHSIIGNGKSPHDLGYFRNCFPVIFVTPEMTDSARQTAGNNRINGLFIIEVDTPVDTLEKLATVNKNSVTALAGPMSLVLVKHNQTLYYMEGVALEGLVDNVPEFGTILDLSLEEIKNWALENCMADPIVDITTIQPVFMGRSFTLSEIISLMKTLTLDQILEVKQPILCLYYQLTRIYDDEELQGFGKQLYDVLDKILTTPPQDTEELKKLQEQFIKGGTKMKVSPMYQRRKEEYAKKKKQLKFLMDKVSSLLSEKNVSSKSMTHKQLKRFNAINNNIDMMKKMTREDFEEKLEMSCAKMGVLVCAGEPEDLKNFIDNIGKNKMKEILTSESRIRLAKIQQIQKNSDLMPPMLELSSRQQMLDALTATCLLQLTQGQGALHSVDNSVCLAIPESNTSQRAAVLIPLLDKFVDMKNPYYGNWINLCNDPDIATFRLVMRRTFEKASVGRDLPNKIDSASKDLGWGIVNIYLDIMHQLSANRKTVMDETNFDDTLCQQIRCLFGMILTQLSAGQDPISLIWQLWRAENCRPDLPMQSWHWTLYLEMAHFMQFTGWSQQVFRRNLKILLLRAMNSKIAYPMCAFLRAERVQIKKNKYGSEYKKKLQEVYYPAKRNLVKTLLIFLENGEVPTKSFLSKNENIFSQFPNRSCRKRGIQIILSHIALWIEYGNKYNEKSREFLYELCTRTIQKNEPKLKTCRQGLRRTVLKALSENNAPSEDDVEVLATEIEDASKSFDHQKNISLSITLKEMKKVLNLISNWSTEKENGEKKNITEKGKKIAREMVEKMYHSLEYDCWTLKPDNVDVSITEISIVGGNDAEVERNIMERIFENKNNKPVKAIFDTEKPVLERVTSLAKMIDIDDVNVLIRLSGLAGFGTNDLEIKENLCFVLQELFHRWETDPDVLEKILADKFL